MPSYLLDTSVILDLINDRNDRRRFIRALVQPGDTLGFCLINLIEVYTGMWPGEDAITQECRIGDSNAVRNLQQYGIWPCCIAGRIGRFGYFKQSSFSTAGEPPVRTCVQPQ